MSDLVLLSVEKIYFDKINFEDGMSATKLYTYIDRARRARAFCLIKTVPRRQYIAFSISVLDEWEWMVKRLALNS